MELIPILLLALIQGATEFLPVSSSGHLALFPALTNSADQGPLLDVAVHLGTLGAVIVYFRTECVQLLTGAAPLIRGHHRDQNAKLLLMLGISTIPVVIAGLLLHLFDAVDALRSPAIIAWAMIIFAFPLLLADRLGKTSKPDAHWSMKDATIMGLAQVLALVPGTSRSGVTMTAARALSYDRKSAARLSMLMSIPTILASSALLGVDALSKGNSEGLAAALIAGIAALGIALLAIRAMMAMLQRVTLLPFVIYRVLLGSLLLIFLS